LLLALASAAIGVAVGVNWHARPFLAAGILLNVAYWVVGQGFGGILTGQATDPNAGPLFVLLAVELYMLTPHPARRRGRSRRRAGASLSPAPSA